MIGSKPVISVCEGQQLHMEVPVEAKSMQQPSFAIQRPVNVVFNGVNGRGAPDRFCLSERLLSQHMMLIGGIGSGKTNTFNQILQSLIPQLTAKDVMIIFDTKGDFLKEFYTPGDVVISNDSSARGSLRPDYWNILKELANSGNRLREDVIEISNALYAEKLKNAGENAFFPQAAKDITTAVLYKYAYQNANYGMSYDNATLAMDLKKADLYWYQEEILKKSSEYRAMMSYIPADAPGQALGVLAEIQQMVRSLFVGNFERKGTLSIRQLVREKKGRKIFIEYDIGVGGMLTPIYSLLFDLAIKEALCRDKSDGNVYFVCDEFKLLPNLQHIDDAVNFGRSLGIKFMIGIQNVDQIIDIYGEHRAYNIFSGFLNLLAFKVGDYSSRKYIKERLGENRKCTVYKSTTIQETINAANVVEDWDIAGLKLGEAIVSLNTAEPFKFRFNEFKGRA